MILVFPEESRKNKTVRVLKLPKTESSIRKVFLPKSVAEMLVEWKKGQDKIKETLGEEYMDYNLVMATPFGLPVGTSSIRKALNDLIKEHNLPPVVFHSLRHTSVTYKLKLNGGDIKAVQGDSGHSANIKTEIDGSFSIELEADTYNITISAEDYEEETFEFTIEENSNYSGEQFTISPELAAGSARIVLEWNAQHQDLDSYLWGNTDKGDDLYVNFRKRTCEGRDGLLAELDVDDTNGYGPETITLNDLNGVYTYSVVDYRTTGTLQQYGATVKVYLPGKSAPTVITLDPNAGVENVWEVFELDHGELKILNRAPAEENLRPGSK